MLRYRKECCITPLMKKMALMTVFLLVTACNISQNQGSEYRLTDAEAGYDQAAYDACLDADEEFCE